MLQFEAFQQKFSMAKKHLDVRTFIENTIPIGSNTISCTKNTITTADNSNPPITSAITASYDKKISTSIFYRKVMSLFLFLLSSIIQYLTAFSLRWKQTTRRTRPLK